MPSLFLIIGIVVVLVVAVALVIAGLRAPKGGDPLQARLAEYSTRERPMSLEEIEMSQPFSERILMPLLRQVGEFVIRFTPQSSLQAIQHDLDLAGNPKGIEPVTFYTGRIIMAALGAGLIILLGVITADPTSFFSFKSGSGKVLASAAGAAALGFFIPNLLLRSRINRRQDGIIKSMPDALDLLTVCVEAGLGFDQAMQRVSEKWDNELALAFARCIQEIRLGKLRREALRDMAERMGVPDMTSFVAALIQADQLGVSMAKVLRIQSDQMRMRRRQRAEKKAHEAPIKMLIPMAFLIFPAIYIVLLGPAALQVIQQFGFGFLGGG
ncbi:MAG: type II secretion system F family protein [Anaerolineales bacterium]|nr:type II secretion system F family protein [Anaerolineales bacterium]